MLFGKKKKHITFMLGCLWYYIKRMEDEDRYFEAVEIMSDICVNLGIEWDQMNDAERAYQTLGDFQSGCL